MIKEVYVDFNTADKMKIKGFNIPCHSFYLVHSRLPLKYVFDWSSVIADRNSYPNDEDSLERVSAPNQHLVLRWLRLVHNLYIQIMLDSWTEGFGRSGYYILIQKIDSDKEILSPLDRVFYETPEDATDAAINYCLDNLIK